MRHQFCHEYRRLHPYLGSVFIALLLSISPFVANADVEVELSDAERVFIEQLDLKPLVNLALHDHGRVKSIESYAHAVMQEITGPHRLGRASRGYTFLDMLIRPNTYADRAVIYIKKKPIRKKIAGAMLNSALDIRSQIGLSSMGNTTDESLAATAAAIEANAELLMDTGLVSDRMLRNPVVEIELDRLRSDLIRTAKFAEEIDLARAVAHPVNLRAGLRIIPPPAGLTASDGTVRSDQMPWITPEELATITPGTLPGLSREDHAAILSSWKALEDAWAAQDANAANNAIAELANIIPTVNTSLYPETQRTGWPWALPTDFSLADSTTVAWLVTLGTITVFALFAMVLLIRKRRASGIAMGIIAVLLVALQIGTLVLGRLDWLALESAYFRNYTWFTMIWVIYMFSSIFLLMSIAYRWTWARVTGMSIFTIAFMLHSVAVLLRWYVSGRWPNSNMFEAVTTAAWFGGCAALVGEVVVRRTKMANLFALGSAAASMTALMAAHFLPQALNASISNRMPVLDDVWLYIHTNVIIFSYCLIFMAAIVAGLYLFYRLIAKLRGDDNAFQHYARVGGAGSLLVTLPDGSTTLSASKTSLGQIFDGATMILMELSFVLLWAGIVMGAMWADDSWGRPWGWDPKEVFALNTFIVFAVLVHVRYKARDKGLWTSLLTIVGCVVMLFNWIFINFKIAGLHSYA